MVGMKVLLENQIFKELLSLYFQLIFSILHVKTNKTALLMLKKITRNKKPKIYFTKFEYNLKKVP